MSKDDRGSIQPALFATDTARRLQVGLGGLLAVMLLVGLASMIGERNASENAANAPAARPNAAATEAAPTNGPLAELGVQPAAADAAEPAMPNPATQAPPPAPASSGDPAVVRDMPGPVDPARKTTP